MITTEFGKQQYGDNNLSVTISGVTITGVDCAKTLHSPCKVMPSPLTCCFLYRTIGNTTAEKITFLQKEPSTDKKTLTKNAEEAASLHQQSLNIIDKITSQFSFVMRTSQFLNGICTDEGAAET